MAGKSPKSAGSRQVRIASCVGDVLGALLGQEIRRQKDLRIWIVF